MTTAPDEATANQRAVDRDLLQEMGREFLEWSKCVQARIDNMGGTSGFPHAGTPGWLPNGWHKHSRFAGNRSVALYLVRREAGGWALVPSPATGLYDSAATLCELYERYRSAVGGFTVREPVARWLGSVLSSLYDPTIEDEAAAQVVVALGGVATLEPRAVTVGAAASMPVIRTTVTT